MAKLKEMIGLRFSRLVVMSRVDNNSTGKPRYFCRCDCGRSAIVDGKQLRTKRTHSCGCYRYEKLLESLTKHGYSSTKTYAIWTGMRDRCLNKNDPSYKNYGGRGVSICKEWNSFPNFLADMGHKPKGMTIDRINSDGNYEPSNCRWATPLEQANNRRTVIFLEYKGIRQSLADWARQLGIPRTTLYMRYLSNKSVAQILGKAKQITERVKYKGSLRTFPEIAKLSGVPYVTLRWRIRKGISVDEAVIQR